jgi:DNA end-binding protein Ku
LTRKREEPRRYYLYPDGQQAEEAYRVIAEAITESGTAGIGRLALRRREHMVVVQPRDGGTVLFTLRAAEEVLPAGFPAIEDELDPEMIELAKAIVERRNGPFDPAMLVDPYKQALRRLVEAKQKGEPIRPERPASPSLVADLMTVLRRSLAQESEAKQPAQRKRKASGDRRQRSLLLPVAGRRGRQQTARSKEIIPKPRRARR